MVMVASYTVKMLDTGGVFHLRASLYGVDTWPAPMTKATASTSQTIIGEFPFVAFGMPSERLTSGFGITVGTVVDTGKRRSPVVAVTTGLSI